MIMIFEKNGIITPGDDKTNITFSFPVQKNVKALTITYRFSPTVLEDEKEAIRLIKIALDKYDVKNKPPESHLPLKNLVTLSLDSPTGYRGAVHRHESTQKYVIGEDFASPGFIRGEINEGEWQISLNVHCALSNINYELQVEGEDEI